MPSMPTPYTPKHTPPSRPNPEHPRPWHREAVFGEGTRRILSARERDGFGHVLTAFARAGLIPPGTVWTGLALRDCLDWKTGQCDPSHGALGQHVRDHYGRRSDRTVERDLCRLRDLGAVTWEQRLVRAGWRTEQTSNAYCLHPDADGTPRALPAPILPRAEQPAAEHVRPCAPYARPLPTHPEPAEGAAERGGAGVPPAVQTAHPVSYLESRRDSGFSATMSAGSGQPTPPPSPAPMPQTKEARIAAKFEAERAQRARERQVIADRIRRGLPGTG